MLSKTLSYALNGLDGFPVQVEVDISSGLPAFDLVGLADTAIKESKERTRSAVKNSGRKFPPLKITVNLAPADMKKEGSGLDLAIAVGILSASNQLEVKNGDTVYIGELSLDGSLRKVNGLLPLLIAASKEGYKKFIVPFENAAEASYIEDIDVVAAKSLKEVIDHISGLTPLPTVEKRQFKTQLAKRETLNDMSLVRGQYVAKRALEIAVSGGHNILMIGPPGTGKTMLAKCIPTIMPDMSFNEALESTKIHSVAGLINNERGIMVTRPFRSPHHTATRISMCGGGTPIRPGEISLAHNGVLFLDEMPEYARSTLEALRQPLEDGVITISRATQTVTYPANFMLCGSMNPCPCGNYGSHNKTCTCTAGQIKKYKDKISGPLLDRIDIQVQVDNIEYDDLIAEEKAETSAEIKRRVNRARLIQRERFEGEGIYTNADMGEKQIKKYCKLSAECEKVLKDAYEKLKLSARARSRIIKVARTIADISLSEDIKREHVLEAISYRQLDD